ncbi:MAG: hypothetical protein AAF441_19880 [Pseudomonadota bacterium]
MKKHKRHSAPDDGEMLDRHLDYLIDRYTAAYQDIFNDPVNKNRLAAVQLVRQRHRSVRGQPFVAARQKILQMIDRCSTEFDPPFDTEYGSGRGVFSLLSGAIGTLGSAAACCPTRLAIFIYRENGDELLDEISLDGVELKGLRAIFDPGYADADFAGGGGYRVRTEHLADLDDLLAVAVEWDLEACAYYIEAVPVPPLT